jgi:2-polyprenyl-6-methoxyphenol hydroxylase-like FAD-dependent oxidoreductase
VTVLEAYDDPGGAVGSFVSLAANGLRGLAAAGCLDRVRERGFGVPRQLMVAGSGKVLGDVARGRRAADPMVSVTLLRAHLVAELRAAALEAGAGIVTGARVTRVTPLPGGGAQAELAGGDVLAADLLVGADGLWSATRATLDPDGPAPSYAGHYGVSGVSAPVPGVAPATFTMTFGRRGTFVHVPAPDGSVWWQAQVTSPAAPARDVADDARLALLRDLYRGEALPSAVLEAATTLHRTTVQHVLPPVGTWHRGAVVLVGDAAHPLGAGQGASMAIEDGVALAAALAGAPSLAAGLAAYEAARRPRIAKVLRTADGNRAAKQAGPVRRRVQELVMPLVMGRGYERATGWLFDHRPEALPAAAVLPADAASAAGGSPRSRRRAG